MSYRTKARKILAEINFVPPRHPQPAASSIWTTTENIKIFNLLKEPALQPLVEFLEEYASPYSLKIGYFYDPFNGLPDFTAFAQASLNPRSQAYCAKIPLSDNMGSIFIVPLKNGQPPVIILKPARSLRNDHKIKSKTIHGVPVAAVFAPYVEMDQILTSWALIIEATSAQKNN